MRVIVLALAMVLAAGPAQAITCQQLQTERDKAAAGSKPAQGFVNGWMSGVMGMSSAHIVSQHKSGRTQDYCLDVEAYMDKPYMSYDELMELYDAQIQSPRVKAFLDQNPNECYAEVIALFAIASKFPCQ